MKTRWKVIIVLFVLFFPINIFTDISSYPILEYKFKKEGIFITDVTGKGLHFYIDLNTVDRIILHNEVISKLKF
ncbi:MAG: hypothetical protein LBG26_04330 [Treponema sp.]|jgi:hypothetical protein|nr:hypothetical protein [Treponema sp.]